MGRYIDVEKIDFKGVAVLDENLDRVIPLSEVRKAIQMTPTADVAPRSELERWRDMYYRANAERMASKNDYDSLMRAVESERRMAGMNVLKATHQEIINARIVNQRALAERRNEPGVDPRHDANCSYINGRIDALSCLLAFVEDFERIYMEEEK